MISTPKYNQVNSKDLSWGRLSSSPQALTQYSWKNQNLSPLNPQLTAYLPHGMGRSYGDSCLNQNGLLISSKGLRRFISFNNSTGVLEAEAGITFADILKFAVPRGWFLPVTPGTKFITLGGAIANDVHGKNHHSAGTFGGHVHELTLIRSDGSQLLCNSQVNNDLLKATIGGLGLTGFITQAKIQLKKIISPWMDIESYRFRNFDEFCELSQIKSITHEYTVAWIDALAQGEKLGQGLLLAANHYQLPHQDGSDPFRSVQPKTTIPFNFPSYALNPLSVQCFNWLYINQQTRHKKTFIQHYDAYFYPLDAIGQWNRIYGKQGFYQYQCAIPYQPLLMKKIIQLIAQSSGGSFLTVLKEFGEITSPGMLSFPIPGFTLALDFPNKGMRTVRLLNELDDLVLEAGGRVYPAKDARMSAQAFQQFYPNWQEFAHYIDPKFTSDFWRRVSRK